MVLIKPLPIRHESARGYVLRLSEQNGLETPRWLLSLISEGVITQKGHVALGYILNRPENALSGLCGPIANLAQLNAPDLGRLSIRYWNTRRPKFCPRCLTEAPYWRASWDLLFAVACDKHGVRLHDCCPQCEKPLSWDRSHIAACACGFDLRGAALQAASPGAVELAREVKIRLQEALPDKNGIEVLHNLHLESLLKLVWFLGAYSRNAHLRPQKVVGLEKVEVAGAMVRQAMVALTDWPRGFHRLLEEIVARRILASSGNKLGTSFGGFYRALYKSFPGPEFEFLRRAFEEYLREHWTGQLARRNRRLSSGLRSEHEWVSIAEAARQLKVRVGKVKELLADGLLKGHLHLAKSGRQMGSVSRTSLMAMVNKNEESITLKEARSLLGISRKHAYLLLDQGVLKPLGGPTIDGRHTWTFNRSEVLACVPMSSVGQPLTRPAI